TLDSGKSRKLDVEHRLMWLEVPNCVECSSHRQPCDVGRHGEDEMENGHDEKWARLDTDSPNLELDTEGAKKKAVNHWGLRLS
ncbi:MAG: hypothetical protein KDB05_29360, partial [Planctomycetales bacterium]|nr:hypothetical protein [Planctomycetales bacterium]